MKDVSQPVFWLDVRKEYIIENFDKMLSYLELYNYDAEGENGDFDKTFECLRDFVKEIFAETKESNLCRLLPYRNLNDVLLVRVVAAYLLVCHKTGMQDLRCLSLLANRLLLMDVLKLNDVVEKLRLLQFNCLRRHKVVRYSFTWSDLKKGEDDFQLNIFCYNLAHTEFCDAGDDTSLYYENKGIAVIDGDVLRIAPMNYAEYVETGVQTLFKISDGMEICVDRKDKAKADTFGRLADINSSLVFQQKGVRPSPEKILRDYDVTDSQRDILVKVEKNDIFVYARTIDPDYNVIEGYIYLPAQLYDLTADYMKRKIHVGDILKVRLQDKPKIPFTIAETFEKYYEETAEDYTCSTLSAVYYGDYKVGRRWLTENGLFVNIRDDKTDDTVQQAVDNGKPLPVSIAATKLDKNNNYVINGNYELYSLLKCECDNIIDFIDEAHRTMMEDFLSWCSQDYVPEDEESGVVKIDAVEELLPMAYVFYKRANLCSVSTMQRYQNLIAARMIAQLCGAEEDSQFISHEMSFLNDMVRFAQGENPQSLKLNHDVCLDGNEKVEYRERIIRVLSQYEENGPAYSVAGDDAEEDILPRVSDLVEASNILLNKISGQEINRIKKNIAATLGVEDMFKNNEDEATYYGEENDSLEFKSSIVFPPVNKRQSQQVPAEATRQKWEILKAVCGFLNSMSGGEILLGVRDNGYPCGLKDDLEYLYKSTKIVEPTMDKLILYVKSAVDRAFCDDSGIASEPKEITHGRVRYISDKNKEKTEVLRIQVKPYEFGVVEFKDKASIPEGMSASYQRSSNTTAPLTAEMKRQLRENKLSEQERRPC